MNHALLVDVLQRSQQLQHHAASGWKGCARDQGEAPGERQTDESTLYAKSSYTNPATKIKKRKPLAPLSSTKPVKTQAQRHRDTETHIQTRTQTHNHTIPVRARGQRNKRITWSIGNSYSASAGDKAARNMTQATARFLKTRDIQQQSFARQTHTHTRDCASPRHIFQSISLLAASSAKFKGPTPVETAKAGRRTWGVSWCCRQGQSQGSSKGEARGGVMGFFSRGAAKRNWLPWSIMMIDPFQFQLGLPTRWTANLFWDQTSRTNIPLACWGSQPRAFRHDSCHGFSLSPPSRCQPFKD